MTIKNLFKEKCPQCKEHLTVNRTSLLSSQVVKFCPKGHYEKEYHPALESYIETVQD
ncbi:hypothetical protein MUO14_02905 [Halobacillus shinanisalinarum]|uniref:Uncharacterized protein n=1 Tax=Halobacillus shinanisalinarum TaxID=2932258 RepID=A0ABY4H0H3_9BACI|nr:hypothetical protein [Halobacillus shinanisalinarum]UOQ93942.1 hypothetical protein MUO14_02905 [Halobacillus shinanisalinarum]